MTDLLIRRLEGRAEVEACARMMAGSEPWLTLGRGEEACRALMEDSGKERFVALANGVMVGLLVLDLRGALAGYIQSVCVAPERRGAGIGTALVRFAEARIFRESPNVFLCVSSFNPDARRLYERLGYTPVGELIDYLVAGHSELLFRKTIGPIGAFRSIAGGPVGTRATGPRP